MRVSRNWRITCHSFVHSRRSWLERGFWSELFLEAARAQRQPDAQVCSLGSAAVGQPGTLLCKDLRSGATMQALPLGPTVSAAGGIAGSLASRDDRVLVTNQANGAILFRVGHGFLVNPLTLATTARAPCPARSATRRLRPDGNHAAVLSARADHGHQRAAACWWRWFRGRGHAHEKIRVRLGEERFAGGVRAGR